MYFSVSGAALARLQDFSALSGGHLTLAATLAADPRATLLHSSASVVLADPAPTRLNAGEPLELVVPLGAYYRCRHSEEMGIGRGEGEQAKNTIRSPDIIRPTVLLNHGNMMSATALLLLLLLPAGVVASLAPMMGAAPAVDKNVAKWLHVHVRPSVRGLLRVLRSAREGSKKGGIVAALRQLADGHWVLAFPDSDRAATASLMVRRHAERLRSCYSELLVAFLSAA